MAITNTNTEHTVTRTNVDLASENYVDAIQVSLQAEIDIESLDITDITAVYTGLTTDQLIRCSGGSYAVYLPEATASGQVIVIKNLAATVTVTPLTDNTIDEAANKSTTNNESYTFVDGEVGVWNILD